MTFAYPAGYILLALPVDLNLNYYRGHQLVRSEIFVCFHRDGTSFIHRFWIWFWRNHAKLCVCLFVFVCRWMKGCICWLRDPMAVAKAPSSAFWVACGQFTVESYTNPHPNTCSTSPRGKKYHCPSMWRWAALGLSIEHTLGFVIKYYQACLINSYNTLLLLGPPHAR